jgi:hypothetical protein
LWKEGEHCTIQHRQDDYHWHNAPNTYPWTTTAALGVLLLHILDVDDADTAVWLLRTAGRNALVNDLILGAAGGERGKMCNRVRGWVQGTIEPSKLSRGKHDDPSTKESREHFVCLRILGPTNGEEGDKNKRLRELEHVRVRK